jgi:hypothetical protein|tara:strand:- start:458 stop:718 length:261 start_codon:yes stop_codon:yes gene_type:complete
MNTILILTIIIGGTMAHVKGHINVPARDVKENEVKTSFFKSFDSKPERITIGTVEVGGIYGEDREGFSTIRKMFKKNYKKGGKVSK